MKQWLKRCVDCIVQRYYAMKRVKCGVCGGRLVELREE